MEVPGRNQGLYVLRTAAPDHYHLPKGYYDKFQPMGTKTLIGWMIVAFLFLAFVIGCSCGKSTAEKVDK